MSEAHMFIVFSIGVLAGGLLSWVLKPDSVFVYSSDELRAEHTGQIISMVPIQEFTHGHKWQDMEER